MYLTYSPSLRFLQSTTIERWLAKQMRRKRNDFFLAEKSTKVFSITSFFPTQIFFQHNILVTLCSFLFSAALICCEVPTAELPQGQTPSFTEFRVEEFDGKVKKLT